MRTPVHVHWGWSVLIGLVGGTLGILLGYAAYSYGGIPHDHDRYGVVAVPGQQILNLPAGRVMLDHANDVRSCRNGVHHAKNPTLRSAPPGMAVRITSISSNREPLQITSVPTTLYESHSNCRGHEPFGRIDVPSAGAYLIEATDDAHFGLVESLASNGSQGRTPTSGPAIAVGAAPWAPFGMPVLSGAIVGIVIFGLATTPIWFLRYGKIRRGI